MSKVNYPKQNEIDRQIQAIIKNSGMFEDGLTYDGFIELKPIQKKNEKIIWFMKNMSSLAAIVSLIVFINFMGKPLENTTKPLTRYETNDAIEDNPFNKQKLYLEDNNINIQYISSDRIVEYKNSAAENIEFQVNDIVFNNANFNSTVFDTNNCGKLECTYPSLIEASMKNNDIEEYYQNVIKSLEKRIHTEYLKGVLSKTDSYTNIKYYVNGSNTTNNKLITFLADEQVTINEKNIQRQFKSKYAKSFNLETGKAVELNELFDNFNENVMDYINECINTYYKQTLNVGESVGETEVNEEKQNEEFNWYLSEQGIVFLVNNLYYNNSANEKMQNSYSGSVLINYSDFYKQGMSFNSTYIDY